METDHNEGELITSCIGPSTGKFINYVGTEQLTEPMPVMEIAYLQVIPDSQYFTELEQILVCLQLNWDNQEYMITALKNSISKGYKMIKP